MVMDKQLEAAVLWAAEDRPSELVGWLDEAFWLAADRLDEAFLSAADRLVEGWLQSAVE